MTFLVYAQYTKTLQKQQQGQGLILIRAVGSFSAGGAPLTFSLIGESGDEAKELELELFQQIRDELIVQPAALYLEAGSESSMDDSCEEGSTGCTPEVRCW